MGEYYAVVRSTDHLAHYGVKGMKWGVRKAIARGDQRALDRHFRKAAKKLAKLQDIGLHSGKYAAKSAAYGAAAAGAGALTVGGTNLAGNALNKIGQKIPNVAKLFKQTNRVARNYALSNPTTKENYEYYEKLRSDFVGENVKDWGKKPGIEKSYTVNGFDSRGYPSAAAGAKKRTTVLTNEGLYRIGTGLLTAGLAAKSAQNAYRASHGSKYREKAQAYKDAMDETFAGTKYAGQYVAPPKQRKRRK